MQFRARFAELRTGEAALLLRLHHNPFEIETTDLPINLRIQHVQLRSDMDLRCSFQPLPVERLKFWKRVFCKDLFPTIRDCIVRVMTHFGTTYRCEAGFSFVTQVKDKYANRLGDDVLQEYVRLHVTSYTPADTDIVSNMQLHGVEKVKLK
jgi:hypothetical protein